MKDKLLDEYPKNDKNNAQSNDAHIYSGLLGLIPSQRKDSGTKHQQQNNKKYGGLLDVETE